MSEYKNLKVGGSFQTRLYITNCDNIPITQEDVAVIQYTIFRRDYETREPVPGFADISVPIDSIYDQPIDDAHTGKSVNFSHTINPRGGDLPFPEYSQIYVIQYKFIDQTGAVSIFEIEGLTQK